MFFLIPATATIVWPLIAYYLALQIVRYWLIGSLGRYWTHRIITLPDAPIVARGPYAYLSHPNYALTIVETFVLPFCVWRSCARHHHDRAVVDRDQRQDQ